MACSLLAWTYLAIAACASCSAQLPPTQFYQQPGAKQLELPGNTRILNCDTNGNPKPSIIWIKDNKTLASVSGSLVRLSNIAQEDAGSYQCIASNPLGSLLSLSFNLVVADIKGYKDQKLQIINVTEDESVIINQPEFESFPQAAIYWKDLNASKFLDNEALRYYVSLKNDLLILHATKLDDHNKSFKSFAINSYTEQNITSQIFTISVKEKTNSGEIIPPKFLLAPTNVSVTEGENKPVRFECVVDSRLLSYQIITWYKISTTSMRQAIRTDNTKFQLISYGRILTILTPTVEDSGIYQCEVICKQDLKEQNITLSAYAVLSVYVKPQFIASLPSHVLCDVGDSVAFSCSTTCAPYCSIAWYKNALALSHSRIEALSNGTLIIRDLDVSDAGVYQCFIANLAGEISSASWLEIKSIPPYFVKFSSNMSVTEGDEVVLQCEVAGAPLPVVNWSRNIKGRQEKITSVATSKKFEMSNFSLRIFFVAIEDAGSYVCNASNKNGFIAANIFLQVKERTRVIPEQQRNQTSIKGTTAELPCAVQHDSSVNVSWLWFFSNRFSPINPDERYKISSLGSLRILSVRGSDIGFYSCYAISDSGNVSTTVFLNVIELPYPPVISNVSLSSTSNKSIVIYWTPSYDGNSPILGFILKYLDISYVPSPPKCDETWKIANSSIPASSNFYILKNLQYSRSYQVCMSSFNELGESDGSSSNPVITLPQHAPSSAPIVMSAIPKSNSSILLQWRISDPDTWNGDPLGYSLRYKLSGYPDSTYTIQEVTPSSQSVTKEVNGLIVWQEYEVAVALFNAAGVGVYSPIIKVKTEEGIPFAAPNIQKFEPGASSTEINVQWFPAPPQSINGVNLGYKIFLVEIRGGNGTGGLPVRVNESAVLVFIVQTDSSNLLGLQAYTIKGLKKFQTYEVCIVCFTSKGNGPPSVKVNVTTNEDVPGPVENMKFTEVKDSSVIVVWEPPLSPNGILTGYNLSYWQINFNDTSVSRILPPDVTSQKIINLLPTTLYHFRLCASTRVGEGSVVSAEITSGITPIVPSPATSLLVSSIKERSAILTFVPGSDGYSPITKWIVEYRTSQSTEWSFLYSISDPPATSILISNLHPNTKYQLRIISENIAGRSLPSEPSSVFDTPQAPPSYPPNQIFVTPINESSLYVKWVVLPLVDWNGEGRTYTVQWWSDSSSLESAPISNEVSSYRIAGLKKFAFYFVSVASCNVAGCSNFSVPVLQRTLESVPSLSPSNFTVVNIRSASVELSWSPVNVQYENGVVLGYKIFYWKTGREFDELSTFAVTSKNQTQCNVTSLTSYETYFVSILAYSNMGDGAKSQSVSFMTLQDVPSVPTKVRITNVSDNFVTLNWDEPTERNGIITGYKVGYRILLTSNGLVTDSFEKKEFIVDDSLDSYKRDFTIKTLLPSTFYEFCISAKTSIGWGLCATIVIYTSITLENPPMPISPFASPVDDQLATLTFKLRPGKYLILVRNFTVEILKSGKSSIVVVQSLNPSETTNLSIPSLKPFTSYKFRAASCNDVGCSNLSSWSNEITTFGTSPSLPPGNLSATIVSASSVLLSWIPPLQTTWNGPQTGYEVFYRDVTREDEWINIVINDVNQFNVTVDNLGSFMTYLFKVRTINSYGKSYFSVVVIKFIELIPLSRATDLKATGIYSRSVNISWSFSYNRTFVILGFKITCSSTTDTTNRQEFILSPDANKSDIGQLKPFSTYVIDVVPYNDAGPGKSASPLLQLTTNEDVPEQVRSMKLIVIAPSVVKVSWLPPASPNGILISYELSYYQSNINTSEGIKSSVQLDLPTNSTNYLITHVIESTSYVVTLRSRTKIGWSQLMIGSIFIGPQAGCPGPSSKPTCIVDGNQVAVTWTNGNQGSYPILGSFIQSKVSTEVLWTTVSHTNGTISTAVLNTISLTPNSDLQVKVVHYNEAGIGESSLPSEFFRIAEPEKPFYQQWWFLLIMALAGLIVIITIILVLVLTTRKKESLKTPPQRRSSTSSKSDFVASRSNNFLQLRLNPLDLNESSTDDPASFSHGNSSLRFSLRNGNSPRAVPRSRNGFTNESYDDDDDDGGNLRKSFRSLSDKVSDITASNSQVLGVKVSSDNSPMRWRRKSSSSSPFGQHNYYVNNDDVHPSWVKIGEHHNSSQNFTYEESTLPYGSGSSVLVMSNKPGSRAPLPVLSFFE